MNQKVTDEEIIQSLATVLASHPSWLELKRINVFSLSKEDALLTVKQTYGVQTEAVIILFREDVVNALQATAGQQGFWVSGAQGQEFFIATQEESDALRMFRHQTQEDPLTCVSTDLVAAELVRMDAVISGEDPTHLVSKAFLTKIAAGERAVTSSHLAA